MHVTHLSEQQMLSLHVSPMPSSSSANKYSIICTAWLVELRVTCFKWESSFHTLTVGGSPTLQHCTMYLSFVYIPSVNMKTYFCTEIIIRK